MAIIEAANIYEKWITANRMPWHGTRLQLDGSRLMDAAGQKDLHQFLSRSLASIQVTAHWPARSGYLSLADYKLMVEDLAEMLETLTFCMDSSHHENMFREYKASKHCLENSSPQDEEILMAKSNWHVFLLGDVYSSGVSGRRWVYQCELEDTMHAYQKKLKEYYKYSQDLATEAVYLS